MSLTNEDKDWLRAEMGVLESRLTQRLSSDLEAGETTFLTSFRKWASPTEMRLSSHSLALQALDLEMGNLKERLNKLDPPIPSH